MHVTMQDLMLRMLRFWADEGCVLGLPYDVEKGAGTMNPETFFRILGPEPFRTAYFEPSRRPKDGRFGENPQRVEKHHQLQVVLKPSPPDVQDIYVRSLEAYGIDLKRHDLRFEEDNWESPTLGAWGLGWQVLLDGIEITQFTYFQQAGGLDLDPVSVEITYGIERLTMFINDIPDIFELPWADMAQPEDGRNGAIVKKPCTYDWLRRRAEREWSTYNFHAADVALNTGLFDQYEKSCQELLGQGLVLPAYDFCLKCSHTFNTLDARGAISVTERARYIQRVRNLACACAKAWVESGGPNGPAAAAPTEASGG